MASVRFEEMISVCVGIMRSATKLQWDDAIKRST